MTNDFPRGGRYYRKATMDASDAVDTVRFLGVIGGEAHFWHAKPEWLDVLLAGGRLMISEGQAIFRGNALEPKDWLVRDGEGTIGVIKSDDFDDLYQEPEGDELCECVERSFTPRSIGQAMSIGPVPTERRKT